MPYPLADPAIPGVHRGRSGSRAPMAEQTTQSQSKTTTDHDEIRRWVEEHGGKPAIVKGTRDGDSGVLRIDFPGGTGEDQLEHVSWDEWFDVFDRNNLAFLYQEQKASGEDSTFFKLVNRDNA
ncbi:MAG: bifunctional DNA primase/polymerase [Thermoleophilaceae bacterium]